jgi:hypothetical protein
VYAAVRRQAPTSTHVRVHGPQIVMLAVDWMVQICNRTINNEHHQDGKTGVSKPVSGPVFLLY